MSEIKKEHIRPYEHMSEEDLRSAIFDDSTKEEVRRDMIEELKLRTKILKFISKK